MVSPKGNLAKRFFFICLFVLSFNCLFGQAGKDGAKNVSVANTVVNDYTALTTDAAAGTTSIQVASNTLSTGFSAPLNVGDLIFIIQVQGAFMGFLDDPTYGNIISYLTCGNNEFAEVAAVNGANTIAFTCPLQNNYTAVGRVVVVRVPRYSTLTVNGGASITCPSWNGSTGGILALEVYGTIIINSGGSIDVSGRGFRGGSLLNNNSGYGVLNFRWSGNDYGAEKGESIAGSVSDYDSQGGRYCKGAPANGGGGGNGHNSGGGGGANAGSVAGYNGNGNPDISNASWATAWNLESPGFAASTSSGGGKGGYTFSDNNQNALSVGPYNPVWGGDQRRNNGGLGGRPLDYSTGRIFMGGGGGAGEENNSKGGAGGAGGGICTILTYASVSGSGQILALGANGFSTTTTNGTDGAGGGGGGGTVLINSFGNTSGISINANGGNGGSQTTLPFTDETEGPGGGGGGGYIAISMGAITRNANGGNNGTTNGLSLTEFPPNGATKGGAGINNASVNAFRIITQNVNVCTSSSTTLTFTTQGTPPPGVIYSWYYQATGGAPLGTGTTYTTPVLTSSHTYYVSACPGSIRIPIQVSVSSALSATFSATTVCAGSSTNFSASGTANINTWNWNFGDGIGTSIQQSPSYTYSAGGTYTATLTVSDGVCSSTVSQMVNVNNGPVATFTSSATGACGPLAVQFTNNTSGASGYSWNFGDGSALSTQNSPSHTYAASGTYSVVLTATGSGCTSSTPLSISVGPAPTASFLATNTVCQNDTVFFTNQSVGNGSAITSHSWNFGDGSPASTFISPYHVYSGTGTFNVTLTASSSLCTDDTIIAITVSAAPIANFTQSAVSGCNPLNVNFTNNTTGAPIYTWNFGDGSPSSAQTNPSHTYSTSGTYSVMLIATQGSCADTIQQLNLINVSNSPTSSFSSLSGVCLGDSILFTNSSVGNGSPITSYTWDFGDGTPFSSTTNPKHYYSSSGTYLVKLTTSTGACSDDTTISINVNPGPIAAFNVPTSSGCGSLVANFNNTTTGAPVYSWNFGDGSTSSTQPSPVHTYSTPGTYTVTLIATQGSCADTVQQTNYIHVYNQPLSSFSTLNICSGDSARFVNLSNGNGSPITTYAWTFGDGGISGTASPSHYYSSSGTFVVHLTISTSNCTDDTTLNILVNALPVNNFSSSITHACDSATVLFTNTTSGALTYHWTFGDGGTSNSTSPVHAYTSPGQYTVALTATGAGNCSTTRAQLNMIVVSASPAISFTASSSSICENSCVTFNPQSTAGITSWTWTFTGGSPISATAQNPGSICYSSIGNYDVSLQVSDGFCNSTHLETSVIHVVNCSLSPKADFISSDTVLCNSTCIDFVDNSTNAISWLWQFPGAVPSTSTLENPSNICYSIPGAYGVTLIASNTSGSDTTVYNNFIQVNLPPITPTISIAGNTLSTVTATQYQWYFNNIPLSGATFQQHTALLSGDYSVVITDNSGCTAASLNVYVSLVDIAETNHSEYFYIYPNPAHNEINILFHCDKQLKLEISLYDVLGALIFSDHSTLISSDKKFNYDLKDLAPGMYFIHLESDDHRWIRRLIKQ